MDPEWHWLRLEGQWVQVMVLSEQLSKASPGERNLLLAEAREVCRQSKTYLDFAPVNGPEMLEDCLRLDGMAQDVEGWLATAGLLLARKSDYNTRKQLYYSAGEGCDATPLIKRGARPEPTSKADPWCGAMGLAGQGEWEAAARLSLLAQDDGKHPWGLLLDRLRKEAPSAFSWGWP